ncbi:MAG: hypothetical protein KC505_04990 [Myxococcales bacterium]|nr:hypothetical protein [Myxococcales bacterium]USN50921.1 MAG: hypothetical protein H6731_00445 [Myxococcales bacterium]
MPTVIIKDGNQPFSMTSGQNKFPTLSWDSLAKTTAGSPLFEKRTDGTYMICSYTSSGTFGSEYSYVLETKIN